MKKKPTFKIFNCGVYPYDILFTVGSSKEEIVSYLKRKVKYVLDEEEQKSLEIENQSGRTVRLKNNAMIVWVKTPYLPVIVHELFHVVEMTMLKIHLPLNDDTSEPFAYLMEYLTRQIWTKK